MNFNTNLRIFLVDDDQFSLQLYARQLQNLGCHNLTLFENGTDCLNQLTQEPDIIFLDHGMSILNGLDVLKKIKRFNPDIYVVMLSGQEAIETAVSALKYGAFDYIVKGDADSEKLALVLKKITDVNALVNSSKPTFLKKIVSFS